MKFLKILSINTNSLRSTGKRNDLEARMDMIDSDITVVSETQWNSKMENSAIKISGHQLAARADRKPDNSGGGCCIYVKNNVLYTDVIEKSINYQSQICSIKIKDIYIVAVYRRPHYNKKADEQLVAYLRNEYNGKRVVYCGDFNLKGIDWTPDVICAGVDSTDATNGTKVSQIIARDSIWQEFIIEMGYEQLVEGSTHNLGNLLDIVITNKGSDIVRHKPEVDFSSFAGYSDHAGIIFDVNIVVDNETAMKTVFDYKNCDYTKLTESIIEKGVDQSISDFHKPNGKWTNFRNSILEARFEVCPMKKIGYSQKSPWITDNLRTLLRKERRLRRNACRYHNSNDKRLQTRKKWSKIRDFVHDKVRKSRLEYETKIITSLQFNNQAIFDHFKKLNASNTSPPLKNADGDVVYDDKTKCDMFQDHFVAIFGEEKPKVGKLWKEDGKLSTVSFTPEKLTKVIGKMRLSSAPGIDSISGMIYKRCIKALQWPLLDLFRNIMDSSEFPLDWQVSKVSPLYKGSGSKSDLSRWRPLSLGCTGLRIFERMIEIDFRQLAENSGMLPDFQHGFRKKKSTITNLLSSWNYTVNRLDVNDSRTILSMDGSCAFDILKIDYILEQMEKIGIYGKLGKLLENYLIERFQYVQLNSCTSYFAKVFAGVPQGSVLGPLIFILASGSGLVDIQTEVNQRAELLGVPEIKMFVYADDIKTILSLKNNDEKIVADMLLSKLEDYSKMTGLRFNGNKSQLLRLGNNQLQCDMFLMGKEIPEIRYLKDLGVIFSKTYTFVSMMKVQMAKAKNVIRRIKNDLIVRDARSLKLIYQTYYQPTLLYGSEIWINLEVATINKLQAADDSFWDLLPVTAQKPTCRNSMQVAVRKNLMHYFKHKFSICKMSLHEDFKETNILNATRTSEKRDLIAPKSKLSVKTREFVSVTTKLFNKLDAIKRKTTLIGNFSREVDRMIDVEFDY